MATYRVEILKTFALTGQGTFVEEKVITMHVCEPTKEAIVYPVKFNELLEEGYIAEMEEIDDG